jgi:hypothetical protein
MKQKFKCIIGIFLAIGIFTAASAQEATRKFHQSWSVDEIETLEIINKYGDVKVSSSGGYTISVDVVITARGNRSTTEAIFDDIDINFLKTSKLVKAETKLAPKFRSKGNFSIDYTVNIPADKNLLINNKFGNVVIQQLNARGVFDIGYGNITAGVLQGPGMEGIVLNVSYGKADVESIKDATITLSYSQMVMKSARNIMLDSKYSTFTVDLINEVKVNSRYDTFNFGNIGVIEGESRFTNYKIGSISHRAELSSGYGSIRIDNIPVDFKLIDISNQFAQIDIGIDPDAGYNIDVSCNFCATRYPERRFKGNRVSERNNQIIKGEIEGKGSGKILINSRYGNVNLVK